MLNPIITACILLSLALQTIFSYGCSYPTNGTYLQFTDPDPSNLQVCNVGTYETKLHCCAGNYDSITWYFKDKVYPNWNISKPRLKNSVSFGQRNQVLQLHDVGYEMEGYYKCVITNNEGVSLEFNQRLLVKPPQTGDIIPKRGSDCFDKSARIGENITFYCEFYIGHSELCPLFLWKKNRTSQEPYTFGYESYFGPYSNFTSFVVENGGCSTEYHEKGKGREIGIALHIYNVSDDAYGPFTLIVVRESDFSITLELSKINDPPVNAQPNFEHSNQVAIGVGATLVFLFVLTLFCVYCKTNLQWMYKHYFKREASEDLKEFDAFISHSDSDTDRQFAISQLKSFLESLGYNICVHEINSPAGEDRSTNSVNAVNCSRSCILVLSPDYLKHQLCLREFSNALRNHKQKNIVPVMFRSISPDSLIEQEALQHVIEAGKVLKWKSSGTNNTFWKKLEVRMPPRRPSAEKKQSQYIDRSTSTNSAIFLVPVRSDSNDSAISTSFPDDDQADYFQNEKFGSPV